MTEKLFFAALSVWETTLFIQYIAIPSFHMNMQHNLVKSKNIHIALWLYEGNCVTV